MARSDHHNTTVSGLRLSEDEIDGIKYARQKHTGSERREHERAMVPEGFALLMQLEHGDKKTVFPLMARDLSSEGVGFFHAAFIHVETPVKFIMRGRDGEPASVAATIRWCRHVAGRVHEAGAVFTRPINPSDFIDVQAAAAAQTAAETEPPAGGVEARIAGVVAGLKDLAGDLKALEAVSARIAEMTAALRAGGSAGGAHSP
jgi:hypothetical protein